MQEANRFLSEGFSRFQGTLANKGRLVSNVTVVVLAIILLKKTGIGNQTTTLTKW